MSSDQTTAETKDTLLTELGERMSFLRLEKASLDKLRAHSPTLERELQKSLNRFYEIIDQTPAVRSKFDTSDQLTRARNLQFRHWQSIVLGSLDDIYVAGAQRVGRVHARIGLSPRWYIGGYALILEGIIRGVVREHRAAGSMFSVGRKSESEALTDMIVALVKCACLDMDYSITMYIEAADAARKREEIDRQHAERLAEIEKSRSEDLRQKAAEDALVRQQDLERVTTALQRGLARLSAKDLARGLDDDVPKDFSQIRVDFDAAVRQMKGSLQTVRESTVGINSSASEMATASDDLARRTEHQAANLEQTTAALAQITQQVKETADNARQASTVADSAKKLAEEGGHVIRQTTAAMSNIERSSAEISKIIGVIDEIAFQTNLLALNAGVEAARAGEAGRGFAVVASEVRALAQRSAEAAKEIKGLIMTSVSQVNDGVKLVSETGKSLERIVSEVTQVNTEVRRIVIGNREQATNLEEVSNALKQLDTITQQNAAMVEQATAASHTLLQEAQRLSGVVAEFKLGTQDARLREEIERVAPHMFPASATQERPAGGAAGPRKVAAAGGARSGPADGNWEEF